MFTSNSKDLIETIILNISRCEYEFFLSKANVVGIGLSYKKKNNYYTHKKCLTVLVSKKVPSIELSKENIIPSSYKGIITDVVESGIFYQQSLNQKIRPVICGYSISNYLNNITAGSIGCVVTDGNLKYILSCNHTLALNNTGHIGSPIVQPSIADGGIILTDTIAYLDKYIPIEFITETSSPLNYADCALAVLSTPEIAVPFIAFVGPPKGLKSPNLLQSVYKVGQATELTQGIITIIGVTLKLETDQGVPYFMQQQIITTKMSEPGDSGALLLDNDKYALGMLCAGSPVMSCFNDLSIVLLLLNVALVTQM